MRSRGRRLPLVLESLLLVACPGPAFVVDGHAVNEAHWNADRTKILTQASRDLDCPQGNLGVTLLVAKEGYVGGDATFMMASQVEVSGCGRKAVYNRTSSGWVGSGNSSIHDS